MDFCEDLSDDDILEAAVKKCDRRKSSNANNLMLTKGQLSLMQCGFSKLLQKEVETMKEGHNSYNSHHSSSDDETIRTTINSKHGDFRNCQSHVPDLPQGEAAQSPDVTDKQDMPRTDWLILSGSEEEVDRESDDQGVSKQSDIVMETESSSEEDDDIIFPTQVPSCRQPVLSKEVEIYKSTSENCKELAEEKDGFVFKGDSRQFGFHSTESNFSTVRSFEDIKKSTKDLKEADDISDESDDIEISHNSETRKLRTLNFPKWKERHAHNSGLGNISKSLLQAKTTNKKEKESDSQNIDEFSSSEDNFPVEKNHAGKQSYKCKSQRVRVRFGPKTFHPVKDTSVAQMKSSSYAVHRISASKTEFEHQEQEVESMDRYLGS